MRKALIFLIMVGIIVGILTGALSKEKDLEEDRKDGVILEKKDEIAELNLAISNIDTYNPLMTKNVYVSDILSLIYEPLFIINEQEKISERLASQWGRKDNYTWFIKLREKVIWHDGKELTAVDVKTTIEYLKNNVESPYYANIVNIKTVDIVDNITIVVTLSTPDAYLAEKLTFPIISSRYIDDNLQYYSEKNIGTGPYKYISENDNVIILEHNNEWWNKNEVKLNKIYVKKYQSFGEIIKGFKSSEIDMMITSMHSWKEKIGFIGINSYKYENDKFNLIIPNTKNTLLNDPNLRKAILYAINRENIINSVYDDMGTISDIPLKDSTSYAPEPVEYNVEKAEEILLNAGYIRKKNSLYKKNKSVSFTMIVSNENEDRIIAAKKAKENLEDIGIKVTIKELEQDKFEERIRNDDFELAYCTLNINREYKLQEMLKTDSYNNLANYSSEKIDEIILKLENSVQEEYDKNILLLSNIYNEEIPYIGLFYEMDVILTNKSVKGEYKSNSYNPYQNIINFYK